jgi:hypothetical protein
MCTALEGNSIKRVDSRILMKLRMKGLDIYHALMGGILQFLSFHMHSRCRMILVPIILYMLGRHCVIIYLASVICYLTVIYQYYGCYLSRMFLGFCYELFLYNEEKSC